MPSPTAIGTAAGAAIAVKKSVELLTTDLYELAKGKTKEGLERLLVEGALDEAAARLDNLRRVKTIWQFDKSIDLLETYYPTRISFKDKSKIVGRFAEFPTGTRILVEGTAGQGKSIFLRFLAVQEARLGEYLPVFLELRRVDPKRGFEGQLRRELGLLGFPATKSALTFLANSGRLLLFLDAFDEVDSEYAQRLVEQVEAFASARPRTMILASSRPSSGLAASPLFTVMKVCALRKGEHVKVIKAMVADEELRSALLEALKTEEDGITSVLTTPLMVALLVLRFGADQTLPATTISFYEELFPVLLQRHDGSKPGFRRKRASGLPDSWLRDTFDGLCFITRKAQRGVIKHRAMVAHVEQAMQIVGRDGIADAVLDDFIRITTLITRDGGDCEFVYKSVQEFHAASFVAAQDEAFAAKFYAAMLENRWPNWSQELAFLETLDRVRFLRFFQIPELELALPDAGVGGTVNMWVRSLRVQVIERASGEGQWGMTFPRMGWTLDWHADELWQSVWDELPIDKDDPEKTFFHAPPGSEDVHGMVLARDLIGESGWERVRDACASVLTIIEDRLSSARKELAAIEARQSLLEF